MTKYHTYLIIGLLFGILGHLATTPWIAIADAVVAISNIILAAISLVVEEL